MGLANTWRRPKEDSRKASLEQTSKFLLVVILVLFPTAILRADHNSSKSEKFQYWEALFGICKGLTYLRAVIGWLWPPIDIDLNLRSSYWVCQPGDRARDNGSSSTTHCNRHPVSSSPMLPPPNVHPAMSVESTVFRAWIKRNCNMT